MSTSKPANRDEFKQYCLRRLGAPLLEINVAEEQIEDCVEMALQYYRDYHFDGTEKVYLAHQVTQRLFQQTRDPTARHSSLRQFALKVR